VKKAQHNTMSKLGHNLEFRGNRALFSNSYLLITKQEWRTIWIAVLNSDIPSWNLHLQVGHPWLAEVRLNKQHANHMPPCHTLITWPHMKIVRIAISWTAKRSELSARNFVQNRVRLGRHNYRSRTLSQEYGHKSQRAEQTVVKNWQLLAANDKQNSQD
jgi:hypothetical protein